MKRRERNIIPGFGLTFGITIAMLSLLVLIPLASVFVSAFRMSPGEFAENITREGVVWAFRTSLLTSFAAALINCVFGTVLAWVLVRYDFPGRRILDGLIELPFALPTAVAGITLSRLYSTTGAIGEPLSHLGIRISYTHLGILVAMIFIGIPFVVRAIQPVLEKLDPQYEEAALILGAGRTETFLRVVLPELRPAVLTGFGLAFARGLGEYGSIIYISGNSARDHTQVVSYVIMQKLNYADYAGATSIALVLLIISFLLLLLINMVQIRAARRTEESDAYGRPSSGRGKSGESPAGRRLLIGLAAAFVFLMLVMPLFTVVGNALAKGFAFYGEAVTTPYVLSALRVTLLAAGITLAVNTFFGLVSSWTLTRYSFRGRQVLTTLIDIPFSISPVIAGLTFIMMFGRMGWLSPGLDWINQMLGTDIRIVFAIPGVVLATIFVTFPFVSRELIPVLNAGGREEEEAAALMGAGGLGIFRRITFPKIRWALVYGMILCAARALGEFGAVAALSKTRGETFTMPLEIDALYLSGDSDSLTAAFAVSSVLVLIAIAVLILRSIVEYRAKAKKEA